MESEMEASIKVWVFALASLTYSYFISFNIPSGKFRFLSLLPVFYCLTLPPLTLSTVSVGALSTFLLTWLANFKLLLFSFGQGPLCSNPSISFTHFIILSCLPLTVKNNQIPSLQNTKSTSSNPKIGDTPSPKISKKSSNSPLSVGIKVSLLLLSIFIYKHKQHVHPMLMAVYYSCHLYLSLDLNLIMFASIAEILFGLEFEPQMNEPYLSTSLQDFWGNRWNLTATNSLRPVVYQPIRMISMKIFRIKKIATFLGVLSTFVVSGLIHELIFYQIVRVKPTWQITWFFVLQGLIVGIESEVKKAFKEKVKLHPLVSWAYTMGIIMLTADLFFFSIVLKSNVDVIASREITAIVDFFTSI